MKPFSRSPALLNSEIQHDLTTASSTGCSTPPTPWSIPSSIAGVHSGTTSTGIDHESPTTSDLSECFLCDGDDNQAVASPSPPTSALSGTIDSAIFWRRRFGIRRPPPKSYSIYPLIGSRLPCHDSPLSEAEIETFFHLMHHLRQQQQYLQRPTLVYL